MKNINKILLIIFTFIVFNIFITTANAASANISISSNKSTVAVGDTVTLTITLSSASALGNWEFDVGYDSSYFSFVSSTLEGSTQAANNANKDGIKSKTYTLKLKAKKSGSTKISIKNILVAGWDEKRMSVASNTKTLTLKTQAEIDASKSKNNNLSSLSISGQTINPKFSSGITEYNLEVENNIENITINAKASDSKSKISGAGKKNLEEGNNKFNIVVTAENGSKKTYTINVTRKELDPIKVTIDNLEYTVVRKRNKLEAPNGYNDTTVTIDDKEIPALNNEVTNYTLVGLSNQDGNINLYIYNNGEYTLYQEFKLNGITIYPKVPDKLLDNLKEEEISIDENIVKAYSIKNYPYKIIYGMNVETGKENWYSYDENERTFQIFPGISNLPNTVAKNKNSDKFMILSILLGIFTFIFFITTIILTINNKKKTGINY